MLIGLSVEYDALSTRPFLQKPHHIFLLPRRRRGSCPAKDVQGSLRNTRRQSRIWRMPFGTSIPIPKALSDPRVARIALHCTKVFFLNIHFLEGGQWDELAESNRAALNRIIQSPDLKTLELSSVGVSWSRFLYPRTFLKSLILAGHCHATAFIPLFPRNALLIPVGIESLTGFPRALRHLVDAQLGGITEESFAVDIGRLRTLSTYCQRGEVINLRHVLLRGGHLETLSISATYCMQFSSSRPHF